MMRAPADPPATLEAVRREARDYATRKPGKVPPADSPSRPHLARLWRLAHVATTKRRNAKTFSYAGLRFGVVYLDRSLCVFDMGTREILVRQPTALLSLMDVLRNLDRA